MGLYVGYLGALYMIYRFLYVRHMRALFMVYAALCRIYGFLYVRHIEPLCRTRGIFIEDIWEPYVWHIRLYVGYMGSFIC